MPCRKAVDLTTNCQAPVLRQLGWFAHTRLKIVLFGVLKIGNFCCCEFESPKAKMQRRKDLWDRPTTVGDFDDPLVTEPGACQNIKADFRARDLELLLLFYITKVECTDSIWSPFISYSRAAAWILCSSLQLLNCAPFRPRLWRILLFIWVSRWVCSCLFATPASPIPFFFLIWHTSSCGPESSSWLDLFFCSSCLV